MYTEKEYTRAQTHILADLCVQCVLAANLPHNKPHKKQIELVRIWRGVVGKCGHNYVTTFKDFHQFVY